METQQLPSPDRETFQRVWRRVMPQERPDCPIALTPSDASLPTSAPVTLPAASAPPQQPVACLGEQSAGELPTLDRLLLLTAQAWQAYSAMGGRAQATLPASLAQAKRQQLRRLATARFLISGELYRLEPVRPTQAADPLPLTIRERYQAEQRGAVEFLTAAATTNDPCLTDLFRALAMEDQTHAGQLREWLERM